MSRLAPGSRIALIQPGGLGDAVHTLALAVALRRDDPGHRISWIGTRNTAELVRPHVAVDETIVFQPDRGFGAVLALRRALAGRRFDWVLNFDTYTRSIWPVLFSGARHRMGLGRPWAREGIWLAANERISPPPATHQQELVLTFADRLEVAARPPEWRLTLTEEEAEAQRTFFARQGPRPRVGIVVASGRASKDWPAESIARLADALAGDLGWTVLLLGGPGERENRIARRVRKLGSVKIESALGPGVRRLLWLVGGCDLLVAPDTGALHMAHALGVPVVGLYGGTDPARYGPYARFRDLMVSTWEGERSVRGAMARIPVEAVLERIGRAGIGPPRS